MSEHVCLDMGQLQEDTLPVPHLLGDHLAQPHHSLIHLQPWRHRQLGACGRGNSCDPPQRTPCPPVPPSSLPPCPPPPPPSLSAELTGSVLGIDPDLIEDTDHLIDEPGTQPQ